MSAPVTLPTPKRVNVWGAYVIRVNGGCVYLPVQIVTGGWLGEPRRVEVELMAHDVPTLGNVTLTVR